MRKELKLLNPIIFSSKVCKVTTPFAINPNFEFNPHAKFIMLFSLITFASKPRIEAIFLITISAVKDPCMSASP